MTTTPSIALIDYGMGNLQSVRNALQQSGARVTLVTEPPVDHSQWDGMVLPGVGAMGDCAVTLEQKHIAGWIRDWIRSDRPFLGICLGLQALFTHTEEGDCPGLDIFKGEVKRFQLPEEYKIPHMGWNTIHFEHESPLLEGVRSGIDQVYFVHSYYVQPEQPELTLATTHYGHHFTSAIQRGRCFATQFHPEKSQRIGMRIFSNFLKICTDAR
jgi:glutamine amidotransferase